MLARGILMEKRLELIILTRFGRKIKQKYLKFMKLENVEVCREPYFRISRQSPMTTNSLTNHTLNNLRESWEVFVGFGEIDFIFKVFAKIN